MPKVLYAYLDWNTGLPVGDYFTREGAELAFSDLAPLSVEKGTSIALQRTRNGPEEYMPKRGSELLFYRTPPRKNRAKRPPAQVGIDHLVSRPKTTTYRVGQAVYWSGATVFTVVRAIPLALIAAILVLAVIVFVIFAYIILTT